MKLSELSEKRSTQLTMGKQQKTREARKKLREFQISIEELEALLDRLEQKNLLESDYPLIIEIIKNFTSIQDQFKNSASTIKKLQKLMFGPKTERVQLPSDLKATDTGEKAKGHGKKPVTAWVDQPAQICFHSHEELKEGVLCPKCQMGKLAKFKPSVRVRIIANRVLDVEQHQIQRLRCSACGWLFTATPKGDVQKYPDATPEAMAMSALLKYQSGFPPYRLLGFLSAQGVYLTWTKIWTMILAVFEAVVAVFKYLCRLSANAKLAQNDDTGAKILDLLKANKNKDEKERKAIQTSGLLFETQDSNRIILYRTGHQNAGENLEEILKNRTDPDPPLHMGDALSANRPGDIKTIPGNCLDHFRREFYDLYDDWTEQCEFILTHLRAIYKIDAKAKKKQLTQSQRLTLHQNKSKIHVDEIHQWMKMQMDEKKVEPNSNLGKAIRYGLRHWEKLTAFMRVEGMPLSNIALERLLKRVVLHRKNSLFYKTEKGAYVGDVLMSVIQTANEAKVNVLNYLVALIKNEKDVKEQPQLWLPWNYSERLLELTPA